MYQFSTMKLAPLGVSLLICVLAYGSQVFFRYIEPYRLEEDQIVVFNVLVCCTWICYYRACRTEPGRVPYGWMPDGAHEGLLEEEDEYGLKSRYRWCRKCEVFKPPRAHHCKSCQRYHKYQCNSSIMFHLTPFS